MTLDIKEFRFDYITEPAPTVCVIGTRGVGKSTFSRDFCYHYRHLPLCNVICPSESLDPHYSHFIPDSLIYDEYSTDLVESIVNKRFRKAKSLGKKTKLPSSDRFLLVMDDCLGEGALTHDTGMKRLLIRGRHANIIFLITLQDAVGVSPLMRGNFDYVFIFKEPILTNRKKLFNHWAGGVIPDQHLFNALMNVCTEDYRCMVIKYRGCSNKLEDNVFWYKARRHDEFRFGPHQLWEMDQTYIKSEEDELEEERQNQDRIASITQNLKDFKREPLKINIKHN